MIVFKLKIMPGIIQSEYYFSKFCSKLLSKFFIKKTDYIGESINICDKNFLGRQKIAAI